MRLALGILGTVFVLACASANAASQLVIERAWIRTAPPGAPMLAGYAHLSNRGDEAISINGARSSAFGKAGLHETLEENGISKMRALPTLLLKPGASVDLAPGGRHLMLMQPKGELKPGQKVTIDFVLGDAKTVSAEFTMRDDAPSP